MYEIKYIFTETTRKYIESGIIPCLFKAQPCAPFQFLYDKGWIIGIFTDLINNDTYETCKNYPQKIEMAFLKLAKKLPIPNFDDPLRDKDYLKLYLYINQIQKHSPSE